MKGACPLRNNTDWVKSQEVLGEDNTWKLWIDSPTGEILPPIKGAFYLYIEDNPRKASDLLNKYVPLSVKAKFAKDNNRGAITDLINYAMDDMFEDPAYVQWLAKQDFTDKLDTKIPEVTEEEEVKRKTWIEEVESTFDPAALLKPIDALDLQNKIRTQQVIQALAKASTSDIVSVSIISADEAKTLLVGKYIGYNNQPAIVLGNDVYFVLDNISPNSELADIVLPFIVKFRRSGVTEKGEKISKFDKLYNDLELSPQGQIVIAETKRLNPAIVNYTSDEFKELVFEQVLKKDSQIKKEGALYGSPTEPIDGLFIKAVNEIFAEVRKNLRQAFPGIAQTTVHPNTNLNELISILKKAGHNIAVEEITNQDIIQYNKDIDKGTKEIVDAINNDPTKQGLDRIIENMIMVNSKQLNQTNDPVFHEIKKNLSDESGRYLRDISERLKYLRKENADIYDNLDNTFKAKALVSSLFSLEKTLEKITEFMKNLDKVEGNTEKVLEQIIHYNYLLQGWAEFIKVTDANLTESGVKQDSSIYNLMSRLTRAVKAGNDTYKAIQKKGAVETTTTLLKSFGDKIRTEIDTDIANLKKQPASASRDSKIKEQEEKKEKYNFSKEKIEKLYRGELGDANFWSTMFESYTTNPDPVIASFALFIKGHTQDILNTAYTKAERFMNKARPMMQRLGMNNVNFKSDWQDFLMIDKKAVKGADGKVIEVPILTFMAPVKDWRFEMAKMDQVIKEAKDSGDKEALRTAVKEKELHLTKYFNRKYTKDYYEGINQLLKENPEASEALDNINLEIAKFRNSNPNDIDFFKKNSELDTLYAQRKQLFSSYNEDGTIKAPKDVAIAEALQRHRSRTMDFYESVEKEGAVQRSFEGFIEMITKDPAYSNIPMYDEAGNITPQFKKEIIDEWISQNTVLRYSKAYYTKTGAIFEKLRAISEELPEEYRTDKLYKKKSDILSFYKDKNGQPDPSLIAKENKDKILNELKQIEKDLDDITKRADDEFFVKNPLLKLKFEEAISELSALSYKEPTEYYLTEINQYMAYFKEPSLNTSTANAFLKPQVVAKVDALRAKSPEFKAWFDKNHLRKDSEYKGKAQHRYERLPFWSVSKVKESETDPKYYEHTTLKLGDKTFTVTGTPTSKYFYTNVKDKYRTIPIGTTEAEKLQKYVGTVITNRGEYLPLNKKQFEDQDRLEEYNDPKNNLTKYINNAYYSLSKEQKDLLELAKNYHLGNQVGIDRDQKLYLDLPRYPIKDILEGVQSGAIKTRWVDRIKSIAAGISATFSGKSIEEANIASRQEEDIVDEFSNPDTEKQYEQMTMLQDGILNPVLDKIDIKGIQNLDISKVSYDVIGAMNVYMLQTEKQKVYNKVSPIAQAIANTLENADKGLDALNDIKEKAFSIGDASKHLVEKAGLRNKSESVRAAGFRAFVNREFKGTMYSEKNLDWLNKVTGAITGGASMNFFALNLPSAIKNYWGMLWQMNVEAVAGEYFDFSSMAKGKLRSKQAMAEWTTRIMGGKYDTLDTQMIIRFDPLHGKSEEVISRDFSRTFEKDLASMSWAYSPRKFMEMEGGLQLFYSMMSFKKVKRTINGVTSLQSYADAWELNKDKQMVLKDGYDPAFGITYNEDGTTELGSEFKKFQNAVHEKFKDLNGTFAKFEQPQAQMFFAYRLFAFMRRYFTSMFMNRFGTERANHALETIRTGYYIEAVKSVGKMITSFGQHAMELAPSERRALLKATIDLIQIFAISAIAAMIFGYDDKDEDRWKKLKAKSGALGEDDFNMGGWLSNHALTLLIKTQQENQSFIPLPGFGLNNYIDFTKSTSIAFGPTVHGGAKIMTQIAKHALPGEDPSLYYKVDMGPYPWQKKEQAKIFSTIGGMLGFSGSQVDPVKGLKSSEGYNK